MASRCRVSGKGKILVVIVAAAAEVLVVEDSEDEEEFSDGVVPSFVVDVVVFGTRTYPPSGFLAAASATEVSGCSQMANKDERMPSLRMISLASLESRVMAWRNDDNNPDDDVAALSLITLLEGANEARLATATHSSTAIAYQSFVPESLASPLASFSSNRAFSYSAPLPPCKRKGARVIRW